MTFAHPMAVLWGLLAVPLVLLYWRKMRLRQETMATGMFWERVFAEDWARQSWQRWRHGVSVTVQLTVLLLLVLALAEPLIPPPEQTVIVIDNSASMSAVDVEPSRLDRAKRAAAQVVGGLRECDRAAVLAAGDAVGVQCGPSGDRKLLLAAIEDVPATQGASRVEEAVSVARAMLAGAPRSRIIVLSDAGFAGAGGLADADNVTLVRIGTPTDNLAVSRLVARRSLSDPTATQVLAEVSNYGAQPGEAELDVLYDDRPLDSLAIRIPGDGHWQQVFELNAPGGGRLVARVQSKDVQPADNERAVTLPRGGVQRVRLSGENPFVEAALRADPSVELLAIDGPPAGPGQVDVTVFIAEVPQRLPDGPTIVVGPVGPSDLWQLGEPLQDAVVAGQDFQSPVVAEVPLLGTSLAGARAIEPADAIAGLVQPLAWNAEDAPLILAIDRPAGRVLVFASPLESGLLPRSAAFPVLMADAVDWVTGGTGGEPATDGLGAVEADSFEGRPEADLRVPADVGIDVEQFAVSGPGVPPWLVLVLLAAVLFAAEWCLYQRRWLA
jgi:hypothetical protein